MVDTFLTDLTVRIRLHLKEPTESKWSDTDIAEYIEQAVGDISRIHPRVTSSDTYFIGGTRLITISALTDVKKVIRIQHELGDSGEREVPREFKNYTVLGNYIEVDGINTPEGDENVSGTASATVTDGLRDTTLSQFASTMVYALVKNTTDNTQTWIDAYTDADNVTVDDDIFASGEEYTIYETYPVRVWYETSHTLSETVKTYPYYLDDLIVDGAVAYALSGYATEAADKATIGDDVALSFLNLARQRMGKYLRDLERDRPVKVTRRY